MKLIEIRKSFPGKGYSPLRLHARGEYGRTRAGHDTASASRWLRLSSKKENFGERLPFNKTPITQSWQAFERTDEIHSRVLFLFVNRYFNKRSIFAVGDVKFGVRKYVESIENRPKFVSINKNSVVYKNYELKEVLVSSLSNPFEALVIEQGDEWIKFTLDLYAHNSIVNTGFNDCNSDEIRIKAKDNLREFPSMKLEKNIFGQLKVSSKFKKYTSNKAPEWNKFQFLGYLKREDAVSITN